MINRRILLAAIPFLLCIHCNVASASRYRIPEFGVSFTIPDTLIVKRENSGSNVYYHIVTPDGRNSGIHLRVIRFSSGATFDRDKLAIKMEREIRVAGTQNVKSSKTIIGNTPANRIMFNIHKVSGYSRMIIDEVIRKNLIYDFVYSCVQHKFRGSVPSYFSVLSSVEFR